MRQLSDLKKAMRGVIVPQVTPFNADGSLDLEGMRGNVRWLIERAKGKDFILYPLGSAGEFYAMSDEECKAVMNMVTEETSGRVPVMPGTGRPGTVETIKMCQYAQSVGADGATIILPYYVVPQEESMYLHYKQIAESMDGNFGIMIYNNPMVSGSWIKPPLMKRISQIPNIIAVKENTTSFADFYRMLKTVNSEDAIIFATSELMFSFGALYGCRGFTTGIANFAPDLLYSLYEAATVKDFDKLSEISRLVEPYLNFIGKMTKNHGPHTAASDAAGGMAGGMSASVYKVAMDIIGLRGGDVRLPRCGINEEEKAELASILKDMGVVL